MKCCGETMKMGVPARHRKRLGEAGGGHRAPVRRYRGIGSQGVPEGYVAEGACPELVEGTPEDARKNVHIIRARCAPLSPARGFPVW